MRMRRQAPATTALPHNPRQVQLMTFSLLSQRKRTEKRRLLRMTAVVRNQWSMIQKQRTISSTSTMKTNSNIMTRILLTVFLLGSLVVPSLAAAQAPQKNFCTYLDSFTTKLNERMDARQSRWDERVANRRERLTERRASFDERLAERRAAADEKREAHNAKLEERATTDEQKAAV